jgi:hypothetical protein
MMIDHFVLANPFQRRHPCFLLAFISLAAQAHYIKGGCREDLEDACGHRNPQRPEPEHQEAVTVQTLYTMSS